MTITTEEISIPEVLNVADLFKALLVAKRVNDSDTVAQATAEIEDIGRPYGYDLDAMRKLVVIFHDELIKGMEAKAAA